MTATLAELAERVAQLERVWSLLADANARADAAERHVHELRAARQDDRDRAEAAEAVIRRIGCVCGERGACEVCEWRAAR